MLFLIQAPCQSPTYTRFVSPIRQSRMVPSNQVGQDSAHRSQALHGMQCSGRAVVHLAWAPFHVSFGIIAAAPLQIGLPSWIELPEIVPEPCQMCPIAISETCSESLCEVSYTLQVISQWV